LHNEGEFERKELRERAAIQIMGSVTAEYVKEMRMKDRSQQLQVPSIEDEVFTRGKTLQEEYFRTLVASF
jgi:hypothetical protein